MYLIQRIFIFFLFNLLSCAFTLSKRKLNSLFGFSDYTLYLCVGSSMASAVFSLLVFYRLLFFDFFSAYLYLLCITWARLIIFQERWVSQFHAHGSILYRWAYALTSVMRVGCVEVVVTAITAAANVLKFIHSLQFVFISLSAHYFLLLSLPPYTLLLLLLFLFYSLFFFSL